MWHRQERGFSSFNRTVALPFPVDPDKVDAHFDRGLLTVRLAKHESVRPRKIRVNAE